MKITGIELYGNKRLLLNNTKHITYTPEGVYQLILGTNGCGKSSLLDELGPLPAHSSNYIKGGYKKIWIQKNGSEYVLTSSFKRGNHHTFFRDEGENLNPGGTLTVQKQLVEEHFGITQDIHDLLVGKVKFTKLSPIKRREWITRMCDTDFTYAIGFHKDLKSKQRDAQGTLKYFRERIGKETSSLQTIENIDGIESEHNALHQELNLLFEERDNQARPHDEVSRQIEQCLEDIRSVSGYLVENRPVGPVNQSFDSLQGLDEVINDLSANIKVEQNLKDRIGTEYQELSDMDHRLRSNDVSNLDELKQRREQRLKEIDERRAKVTHYAEPSIDPTEILNETYSASSPLSLALQELPANPDRRLNRDKAKETEDGLQKVGSDIEKCRNLLNRYTSELEHLETHTETECPKCFHRWVPGVSDDQKETLKKTIDKGQKTLEGLRKRYDELKVLSDEIHEYTHSWRSLRTLVGQYPKLQAFWDVMMEHENILANPPALIGEFKTFERDMTQYQEIRGTQKTIEEIDQILNSGADGRGSDSIRQRMGDLEHQINEAIDKVEVMQGQHRELTQYRHMLRTYLEKSEQLETHLETLYTLRDEMVRSERSQALVGVIRHHQERLATVQQQINQKKSLEDILSDLQASEDKMSRKHDVLKALADELSPTDGLIAEQLTGFIQSFVGSVNHVIENVWNHDLIVQPCGLDSGDLDYKFPLKAQKDGESNTAPDIKDGSEGQVEMVDLAFRLVAMAYLSLDDYPVYLDEVGREFDEQHRKNVMSFVKRMVDTGNFTQLFFISHYAAQYGAFTNAEILVLDEANISVPKTYNQHVVMR